MITSEQVTSARKLLRWAQLGLAIRADVGETSVGKFERGDRPVTEPVIDAIRKAFEEAGIEFTETGVSLRHSSEKAGP
jgi:transcriptional regulator with XRE-family HTH domain